MQFKSKLFVSIVALTVIVMAAIFVSSGNMFAGRFDGGERPRGGGGDAPPSREFKFDNEERDGRGGGSGDEEDKSLLPDYSIIDMKGADVFNKSSTKGYYRITSNFKHVNPPIGQEIDWAAKINDKEYPFLAWKKIPSTFANYSFDVLESKLCPQYAVESKFETILDPFNKVAESDEGNNNQSYFYKCSNDNNLHYLFRCDIVNAIMQKKDPSWKPKPGTPYPFIDVTPGMSCYTAAQYAYEMGYIGAYEDKKFEPDVYHLRAELAKILQNTFQFPAATKEYFTDIPKSYWFYDAAQGLAQVAEKKNKLPLLYYGSNDFFGGSMVASKEWFDDLLKYLF